VAVSQAPRRYSVKWERAGRERLWSVTVAGHQVQIGDAAPLAARPETAGLVRVETDGRQSAAWVAADRDTRWVFSGGVTYEFQVEPAGAARRRGESGHHGPLVAPMPATVVRIIAKPGTKVAHGDVLVLLEAMKMELPLRAPRDAEVKAVHCSEGELVSPGRPLVELD
jgi:biotin carboxyl carrier protein